MGRYCGSDHSPCNARACLIQYVLVARANHYREGTRNTLPLPLQALAHTEQAADSTALATAGSSSSACHGKPTHYSVATIEQQLNHELALLPGKHSDRASHRLGSAHAAVQHAAILLLNDFPPHLTDKWMDTQQPPQSGHQLAAQHSRGTTSSPLLGSSLPGEQTRGAPVLASLPHSPSTRPCCCKPWASSLPARLNKKDSIALHGDNNNNAALPAPTYPHSNQPVTWVAGVLRQQQPPGACSACTPAALPSSSARRQASTDQRSLGGCPQPPAA